MSARETLAMPARGPPQSDFLVEILDHNVPIMVATEAAAAGSNLQLCSLVINYDLPWVGKDFAMSTFLDPKNDTFPGRKTTEIPPGVPEKTATLPKSGNLQPTQQRRTQPMSQNSATVRTGSNLLRTSLAAMLALVASLAAAAPDPPCGPGRYVACGNGTVTDTATGLIWLQKADCLGFSGWETAMQSAAALGHGQCGLTDHSQPGDWRLPTKAEWEVTVAWAVVLGCTLDKAPSLTNDPGTGCLSMGPSAFSGLQKNITVWSSEPFADYPDTSVVTVYLYTGHVGNSYKIDPQFVWPVRGGQ